MPIKGSLLDHAFKAMAEEWEFISEYEQLNLATIPARFKSLLLSYLAVLGPETGISVSELRLLFYTDYDVPGGTGTQDFRRLDLASLIWGDLTLPGLERFINSLDKPRSTNPQESDEVRSQEAELLDSWDEESPQLSPSLTNNRFSALTHLSLARPDPNSPSLWSSLLSITSTLPTLTHLSLAYWPAPSLTPNSNTASVHARGSPGPVQLGGTGFYSHSLDNDYSEASNILRRLSLNTICLEWLDLEGCCDWWPALTWATNKQRDQSSELQSRADFRPYRERNVRISAATRERGSQVLLGPDWNDPWRFIRCLRLSQGWVPSSSTRGSLRGNPTSILKDLQDYLDQGHDGDPPVEIVEDVSGYELSEWVQVERRARSIKTTIQRTRIGGNIVEVDHGWTVS